MIQNGVCPERIEVIYNGVEPWADRSRDLSARKSLGVGGNDFMLTIFARYAPEKGPRLPAGIPLHSCAASPTGLLSA